MMSKSVPNKLLNISSLQNKFFALRHGQSLANVAGIISSDPTISTIEHGLSDVGKDQVATNAQAFVDNFHAKQSQDRYEGVAIFSSDFTRARETASIFADTIFGANIPLYHSNEDKQQDEDKNDSRVKHELRLRERFFGDFNGQSDKHYQDVWDVDWKDPNHTEYNVESVNSVVERTSRLILDLEHELNENNDNASKNGIVSANKKQKQKPYQIILVAHGDVLQIMQTAFLKKDGSVHRSLEHLETASVRELKLASVGSLDEIR